MIVLDSIKEVGSDDLKSKTYRTRLADCVILTHDKKILLQYRSLHCKSNPSGLNLFGGHVEDNETIEEGFLREMHEELGAQIPRTDINFIGAVTEDFTNHEDIVHVYFWHDKDCLITGCYEAEARHFDTVSHAISQPKIMDYTVWALMKARELGLIK